MFSLPIPDRLSPTSYADLAWDEINVGALVQDLTTGKVTASEGAHLDPDIRASTVDRVPAWRPLFGQDGSAQGHLRNQGVGVGDVFIFFGLFRSVAMKDGRWVWQPGSRPVHVVWGWLQIGDIVNVDTCSPESLPWARSHPHFHHRPSANNTLYIANTTLDLPRVARRAPGAGVFPYYSQALQLTDPSGLRVSDWRVPAWMSPIAGRPPLSYHSNPERWTGSGITLSLQTVGRGQEFVLDASYYPEAGDWLNAFPFAV
jgi:hypothetical protein